MSKYIKAYIPFLIYYICVIFAYFIFFYLIPKYGTVLPYFGFLAIYAYICCGVFFLGYFMGKITAKRTPRHNFLSYAIYAIVSLILMLFVGCLKMVFWNLYNGFTIAPTYFISALFDINTKMVSIGTFIPFLIGEFIEHLTHYKKKH